MLLVIALGCSPEEPTTDPPIPDATTPPAVVYVGLSIHLEGQQNLQNPAEFQLLVDDVLGLADAVDAYNAPLTWESKEFTTATLFHGDDTLLDLEARGHAVGVHADMGFVSLPETLTQEEFASDLSGVREDLQNTGIAQIAGVSGICSDLDWVTAAIDGGFPWIAGAVEWCALALDDVPEELADCESPQACHHPYPEELELRIHPWRMDRGGNWTTPDDAGGIVMIPTSAGLKCNYESQFTDDALTGCDFDALDLPLYYEGLDEVLALAESEQTNIYKGTLSLGTFPDPELISEWLEGLQPYRDAGQIEWVTTQGMYDVYTAR